MTTDDALLDPEVEQRLRRGLELLAAQTPAPRRRRLTPLTIAAGVALLAAAGTGIGLAVNDRNPARHSQQARSAPTLVSPQPTGPAVLPPIGQQVRYDLSRLVRESTRIVVGTVTTVDHEKASAASGGMDYVLATVTVDRTLRGPSTDTVIAFDYDYGPLTSGEALGARFTEGQRVLLFLADVTGTVNASIRPEHWQVTGGASGLYPMHGDEPDAPFTLEDVAAEVAR